MTSWLQCSLCETVLAGKVFAIPTLRGQRVPTTINKRNYKNVKKKFASQSSNLHFQIIICISDF